MLGVANLGLSQGSRIQQCVAVDIYQLGVWKHRQTPENCLLALNNLHRAGGLPGYSICGHSINVISEKIGFIFPSAAILRQKITVIRFA